jgi:tetratricopeptide (TPR) repeat protein
MGGTLFFTRMARLRTIRFHKSPTRLQQTLSQNSVRRYLQWFMVLLGVAGCLFVIRFAAAYGLARVLDVYALTAGNRAAADRATQLAPADAESHFGRAAVASLAGNPSESVNELEQAVALREADYRLWSELGLIRDQLGDHSGALAAFTEAVSRAPFYSRPRWHLGNVRLRLGDYDGAFSDLSQAAQSNPELIPGLLDLAWSVSRGDVETTEQLARIQGGEMHLAFASLLARKGRASEVVRQIEAAGTVPEAVKRELVEQLVAKGAFQEAFTISHGGQPNLSVPAVYDGGFEASLAWDQSGFVWRVPRNPESASITLDSNHPDSGVQFLRVTFAGNSNPGIPLLSQLLLVQPGGHYRVNFAGRSDEIVSGGLPLVIVSDAAGDQKRLGQSSTLSKGSGDWQHYSFEFTIPATTSAVTLSLQRENCSTSPCPIFGSASLDSFSLEKLR